jgi:hypothetical protein
MANQNMIQLPAQFTKGSHNSNTKIQCITISHESTNKPLTGDASFPPPLCKDKYLQADSRTMRCLQLNHKIKSIGDLVQIASDVRLDPLNACMNNKHTRNKCMEKAKELLN